MTSGQNPPRFLLIETSTDVASVALSEGSAIVAVSTVFAEKSHARLIAPLIQQLIRNVGWTVSELSAVVVSEGPGSYTGLRVGVSIAKGLCFAADLRLIGIGSLQGLAGEVMDMAQVLSAHILPMIDARRMEVYLARLNDRGETLDKVQASIIEEGSLSDWLDERPHILLGDGLAKCVPIFQSHPHAILLPKRLASAAGMLPFALAKYEAGQFADVEAFEPAYLKPVKATKPTNKLLG